MINRDITPIQARQVIGNTYDTPLERLPDTTVTLEEYQAIGGLTVRPVVQMGGVDPMQLAPNVTLLFPPEWY